MSMLLNLLSLLAVVRSDYSGKGETLVSACAPDICLVEPSCENEVLCKLNVGLFILESFGLQGTETDTSSVFTTTVSVTSSLFTTVITTTEGTLSTVITQTLTSVFDITTSSFVSTTIVTSVLSANISTISCLNIIKVSERKADCCTSNSIVITFVKPVPRPYYEFAYLILSPKNTFGLNIPHVFATTFNRFAGIEQLIINENFQVAYKIPIRDIESLIVSITDLGIANVGAFKRIDESLDIYLESDIFTHGPYTGFIPYFCRKYATPVSFKLPDNLKIRLAALHKDLQNSVVVNRVSKWDINRMAVAAFINEIRWLFACNRTPCVKREVCERVECDKVYECEKVVVDYCVFVSACIKAIVYCEEKTDCRCIFTPVCQAENKWQALQRCVCDYAASCEVVNVQVSTDISVLFSEVCPCPSWEFKPCERETLHPCKEELSSEFCLSSSDDELLIKEKAARRRKAAVKVKSETTVSTYGWYVAGGVVAVSVAVVVYVFVL